MEFVNPYLFWIFSVPFVLFALLISTNKERLSRIFDAKVLERLSAANESMPLMFRNIIMFAAIFFMIVALGRPVKELDDKVVNVQGLTLLTALDISGSMRAKDLYPNRLEFAKKKMNNFFDAMPSDEIGVVAFAYNPFVLAPFSSDKETLKMMVEGVDDSFINMGSTDFNALAELTHTLLEKKEPKILVLFTDGGDEKAIAGFSDVLKANKIDLYVVLVGTDKGSPVLDAKGKPMKKKDGSIAITQRNDALGVLAKESGGAYVLASTGKEDIENLVSVIRSKYHNQQQGEVRIKQRVEYFYYPLGLGLFLLLIGLEFIPQKESIMKIGMLLMFLLFSFISVEAGITDFKTIAAAKEAYEAKQYTKSTALYNDLAGKSGERTYDIGNAQYKSKNYDAAIKSYQKAKGVDKATRLHNIGNSYFQKKDLEKAIKSYEEALKIREDKETRFNLELAKKMKKKQEEQEKKKKKKDQQDQKKKKDKKEQDKNKDQKKKEDKNSKNEQKKKDAKKKKDPKKDKKEKR